MKTKTRCLRLISWLLLAVWICEAPLWGQEGSPNKQSIENNDSSGLSFREGKNDNLSFPEKEKQSMADQGRLFSAPMESLYQVHVLGEVNSPGTYRVGASGRLAEVLLYAKGVNSQGSERNIELRRSGGRIRKIDLKKFQILGDLSHNPYLLDDDVIFVPLRKAAIRVMGAVKRPREYEIVQESTLWDAINLAGGFTVGLSLKDPLRVVRFNDGKKSVEKVASDENSLKSFNILNGDVIFAPHMITERNKFDFNVPKLAGDNIFYPSFEDRVFVLGAVKESSAYPFNPYYTVSQYLSLAGGITPLGKKTTYILSYGGEKRKYKRRNHDLAVVNPGDTILIPERAFDKVGWINFFMGTTNFAFGTLFSVIAVKGL